MSDGFKHDHDATEKLAAHFGDHSQKLTSSADTHLGKARNHLGRTKGKGKLAAAAEQGIERLIGGVAKGQQALGKHLDDVGKGLKQTSANHRAHEDNLAKSLSGVGSTSAQPKAPAPTKSWASVAAGGSTPKPGPPKPAPPKMRLDATDPKKTSTPTVKRNTKSDPVDVASGEMVLDQTDVSLPGVLPLILGRTHVSSYRCGGWFGRSWASTLDQRLELDDEGVVFAAEDGMLLVYPVPDPGETVEAVEGPRWPLHWDGTPGGGMRITDPHSGTSWEFALPADGPGPHARLAGALQLPLTAVSDRNGNRIDVHYGAGGVPVEVRHGGGYRIGVETNSRRITGFTLLAAEGSQDEDIRLVGFGYDGNGNLDAVTNSSGLALRYTYDGAARITSWTDRNQYRYRYLYDRAGRCVQTRGDGGFLDAVFAYDTENNITTVTDALGHRTVFHLDEYGRTVRETSPLGAVATTEWDRYGRLLSRTDPLGFTTAFGYDDDGNLAVSTLPDGSTSGAVHNDAHQIVELTALDGAKWRYEYDVQGNLSRTTDPLGAQTGYAHNPLGHPAAVTDALGGTTRVETDRAGLPVAATDPLGAVSTCVRNRFGLPQTSTDALGGVASYGWTVEGRPAWQVSPDGSRQEWRYDPEGNLIEHQDASGAVTRFEYLCFGRLAARTGPDGTRHTFAYDGQLQLVAVTNPEGAQWTYRYDAVGGLLSETDFSGRTITYTRDPAGRLTSRTNGAGQTVRYTRDALGRTVELLADGRTTRYTHDAAGRVVSIADGQSALRYSYDSTGRMLTEDCDGATVGFGYDALGRRILRRTPSGVESRWTYDAAGRPRTLTGPNGTIAFEHDQVGRETTRAFGAVALNHSWDQVHRLTGLSVTAAGQPLRERSFGYRADGALIGSTDTVLGPQAYELDAAARVTGVSGAGWQERYAYDSGGNLSRAASKAEDTDGERTHERGLLRRAGRTDYEYDGQGRLVRRTRRLLSGGSLTWQYQWDSHDQLTAVRLPDGTVWRYRYDPTGRRIAKQRMAPDGVTVLAETRFAWDGPLLAEQVQVEAGRPGQHVTSWDWSLGGHLPLAQTEQILRADSAEIDRRFYAIVTDLVGSPSELVDEHGGIAWQHRSTLWGSSLTAPVEGPDCALRFPGQYHDAETGLHYNVFRYYDPEAARYLSSDPLRLAGGPNPYAYVGNPHTWADPLGLDPTMVDLYHGTTASGEASIIRNGIDPRFRPRPMDFGHGGFYVTNDRRQAERWADRLGARAGEDPAVMHFRVPQHELDNLNGRRFGPGEDADLKQFILHHRADRNGSQMHGYEMVEGKMWMNPGTRDPSQMTLRGHQIAIYSEDGARLFDRHRVRR